MADVYYGTLGRQHLVEGVIRDWAARNPLELEQIKRAAANIMELRGQDHGLTREGYLKGGLTHSLNNAMVDKFGVDWKRDNTLRNVFWRVFAIGRFNTYETWRR